MTNPITATNKDSKALVDNPSIIRPASKLL